MSAGSSTTFMPRPPPPAEALISTGNPMSPATARASSTVSTAPSEPGTTGTPRSRIVALAATLSPMARMCSGRGPMNVIPCSSTIDAKRAFSERNPYPGWMASAPATSAADMIAGTFR